MWNTLKHGSFMISANGYTWNAENPNLNKGESQAF